MIGKPSGIVQNSPYILESHPQIMMTEPNTSPSYIVQQIATQRRNLVAVCGAAVKSLVDKASYGTVDDRAPELLNFCAIIEHVLSHRIKVHQTWYGSAETRWFWDYVKVASSRTPHNCLTSIQSMGNLKTSRGKGRAWIRMALMEKRLSEYLSDILDQTKITKSFYMDGSILLTDDGYTIAGMVLGLNTIDFSFDIRSDNLDYIIMPVIDFAGFLKYTQRNDNQRPAVEVDEEGNIESLAELFWKEKCNKLDAQFRVLSEQKGYLEELVRLREGQLEEVQIQRQKVIDTLHHYESESRRERQQLENVIIELQAQIQELKDVTKVQATKIHLLEKRHSTDMPIIAMSDLASLQDEPFSPPGRNQRRVDDRGSQTSCELLVPPLSPYKGPTAHPDSRSLASASSGRSSVVYIAPTEDSQSMIVLAGSYTSDTSDLNAQGAESPLKQATKPTPNTTLPNTQQLADPQQQESKEGTDKSKQEAASPVTKSDLTELKEHGGPDVNQIKPDVIAACEEQTIPKEAENSKDDNPDLSHLGSGLVSAAGEEEEQTTREPISLPPKPMAHSIIIEGEAEESDS